MLVPEGTHADTRAIPSLSFGDEELLADLGLGHKDLAFAKLELELRERLFSIDPMAPIRILLGALVGETGRSWDGHDFFSFEDRVHGCGTFDVSVWEELVVHVHLALCRERARGVDRLGGRHPEIV